MIFCKSKLSCIQALKSLFIQYAESSGQVINPSKSTIYAGSISNSRLAHLSHLLGFSIGTLPFLYLGVPIFRGKPKTAYFHPLYDKIKLKLASWKASLLSIAGRVQLVNSVIQSMLVHCISVCDWPVSLIKDIERCIRNFIWSGDSEKRKLVTVAWKRVCLPLDEGGLGLRSISTLNEASNLNLCWKLINSTDAWATVLKSRVIKKRKPVKYHIYSSLWSNIKSEHSTIIENSFWNVGTGEKISFWNDCWCTDSFSNVLNFDLHTREHLQALVCDFISGSQWSFPDSFQLRFPQLIQHVHQVTIPRVHIEDSLVWKKSQSGDMSFKDAYLFKSNVHPKIPWAKYVWSPDIPPSKSLLVWRIMHNRMPTDENLINRGCTLASVCNLCYSDSESTQHLFLHCPLAVKLWNWLASILNRSCQFTDFKDVWTACGTHWKPQCLIVVKACIVNIFNTIWYCRNQARYHNKIIQWRTVLSQIISNVSISGNNTRKTFAGDMFEFTLLKYFKVDIHSPRAPLIKEVIWQPPIFHWVKVNTDGALTKNPLKSSCGGIFRIADGTCLGSFAQNLSTTSAYIAELHAAILAIEIAYDKGWHSLWLETDSQLVLHAFKKKSHVAWELRNRWINCLELIKNMIFFVTRIYREGNSCADGLANIGLALSLLGSP